MLTNTETAVFVQYLCLYLLHDGPHFCYGNEISQGQAKTGNGPGTRMSPHHLIILCIILSSTDIGECNTFLLLKAKATSWSNFLVTSGYSPTTLAWPPSTERQ